jgi:TRAP-type C4-dicarboxylate transport system permease small subunit
MDKKISESLDDEESHRAQDTIVENSLLNSILNLKYSAAVICLFGVASALLVQIATRILNISIPGMQALAQLLAVWASFLVVANLEFENKHIRVNYFVKKLPSNLSNIIDVAIVSVSIVFAAGIFLSAVVGTMSSMEATIPTLGLPTSTIHAAPLLGMFSTSQSRLVRTSAC